MIAQMKKATDCIEERVSLSAESCRHLSGMAHRSDTPLSSFDLKDLMAELKFFLFRSARLRQIDVRMEIGRGMQAVYNDPALLQYVVYRVYVFCLKSLEKGQRLVMSTEQEKSFAVISFRLFGVSQVNLAGLSDTTLAAVSKLSGKLEEESVSEDSRMDTVGIRLLLPSVANTEQLV
ncbi:MAG: hypothetical protein D3924_14185 [Candidatus Electrothrix sp. AR4]|nr:hypothetical protein [Candidatus Electrothrix sp. AR4]